MASPITPVSAVAPGSAIFGDNEVMTKAWRVVEARVRQIASENGFKIQQNLHIDDVLGCLDNVLARDEKAAGKHRKIKHIFDRTLQCIQTVGGIVASGASTVFQPSQICFNVVNFVIEAWRKYEEIFESLGELLERCTEFLERLDSYAKSGMNEKLTNVACEHLHLFVEICDRTLKMKQRQSRIKVFFKNMFFLEDDGIDELLKKMKRVGEKEYGLVAAETYKSSREAATEARAAKDMLADSMNKDKMNKEMKKRKDAILKVLGYDKNDLDSLTGEPKTDRWEEPLQRKRKQITARTGEWINEDPLFTSWIKGESPAKPILGLEGGYGEGKTLLAVNIIGLLRKRRVVDTSRSRLTVAYYFIETDVKSSPNKKEIARSLSRSLLWQLVSADEPFMKSVASICEKFENKDFETFEDMWTHLLLENKDRLKQDSIFFIVIDGLDDDIEALAPLLPKFSTNPNHHHTRVLLTGKQSTFETLEKIEGVAFDKITLGATNVQDIELYIKNRMDEMDMLKVSDSPKVSEIRDEILSTLKAKTAGDYYKLVPALDDIEESNGDESEIRRCLEQAGETRPERIKATIDKLNVTRTKKEIDEINEIIIWVQSSFEWLSPNEMEAALALRFNNTSGQQTSLLTMESKIRNKYSLFTIGVNGYIVYSLPEYAENIPHKKRERSSDGVSDSMGEIQPAEIHMLKHYLRNICPKDVYEKFGFEEFFDLKLVRKGTYIYQDTDNAHMILALRCLNCLVEQRTEKTELLHSYANEYLFSHLGFTELLLTDRDLRAEAGELLVKLFTTEYGIESLLAFTCLPGRREENLFFHKKIPPRWESVFDDVGVDLISRWFKDAAVVERVKNTELVINYNTAGSNRHEVLFTLGLKQALTKLFREYCSKLECQNIYVLVVGLLRKWTHDEDMTNLLGDEALWNPTIETINYVERWSQKMLDIEKDAVWETALANLLFSVEGENISKEIIENQARKALGLDSESWRASHILARVVKSQDEAIAILSGLIERLTNDDEWRSQKANRIILADLLLDLGNIYLDIDKTTIAVETYLKSLDESCSHISRYTSLFMLLVQHKKFSSVIEFLEKLLSDKEQAANLVIKEISTYGFIRGILEYFILHAAKETNRWGIVDELYRNAIDTKADYQTLVGLRLAYTRLQARNTEREQDACRLSELIIDEKVPKQEEETKNKAIDELSGVIVPIYTKTAQAKAKRGDEVEGREAEDIFDKIEALYTKFQTAQGKNKDSCLAFARYFHIRGRSVQAKEVIRDVVVQNLEMLSDDDLENDYPSFYSLKEVFSIFGDAANSVAALDFRRQSLRTGMGNEKATRDEDSHEQGKDLEETDDAMKENVDAVENTKKDVIEADGNAVKSGDDAGEIDDSVEKTDDVEENDNGYEPTGHDLKPSINPRNSIGVFCDGCGEELDYAAEIYICMDELGNTDFDKTCYQKLKEGTLERKVCNKDHEFCYIPQRSKADLEKVKFGSVMIGERVITLAEWKDEVKAEYVDFKEVVGDDVAVTRTE